MGATSRAHRRAEVVLARGRYKIAPHRSAKLAVRLTATALRMLRHAHRLAAQLSIDPAGVPSAYAMKVRIKLMQR